MKTDILEKGLTTFSSFWLITIPRNQLYTSNDTIKVSFVRLDECQNYGCANMNSLAYHNRCKSVELHREKLGARSVTITTPLVDTAIMPMLLKLIISGKLQPLKLITSDSMES